ncbi:alpha/beta hydrolase family protein [Mycolicibacterium gilvum]|uniref:Lysophospholipase n=2 Tax=Mycolicibacterium gilvum TaxID=1804 RepID=E6TK08_MYCSR|nr:lipase family protein [Mycolicibacterium gilvum]ADT98097.1 lysophospholipase [Mycolicibacterium gilvum Spyr1]MCV7058406.1 alpha/beta fold hydrolase [Mycolicibacterium gilvum]STZ45208.1 secretory lipase [Mycolicibacterium gilvum]
MTDPIRRVLAAAAAVATVVGCAHATEPELRAGQLLTARPLTTVAALPSADNRLITYVSDDSAGEPIVVSGTVSVPKSEPPEGGWPVINWAHGTTGYADTCAPSAATADGLIQDYVQLVRPMLDRWVARGFAVVQTDYQGLGTPGGHPYVDGVSESNTVTDIVRAARHLDPGIGTAWVVLGHSQGGQAALFAAHDGPDRDPDLRLLGAVAMAPGGVDMGATVDLLRAGDPGVEVAQRFVPLLVLGAAVVDPSVDPDQIFTTRARPLLTTARNECLAQLNVVPTIPASQVLAPDADLRGLLAYLDRQDPLQLTPRVPVLIAQGTEDVAVNPVGVDKLAKALCGKGVDVDYNTYPGKDHRGVIAASEVTVKDFVDAVMDGRSPENCPR